MSITLMLNHISDGLGVKRMNTVLNDALSLLHVLVVSTLNLKPNTKATLVLLITQNLAMVHTETTVNFAVVVHQNLVDQV
tara:strand:- start:73 stop:312 length:240 start_codon:yes stop_codon:yes gene_type:complete